MAKAISLKLMYQNPAYAIALGFGSGLSPKAPGTAGTLLGWIIFVLFDFWFSDLTWGCVIVLSLLIGLWACQRTTAHLQLQDPGAIVWDEIVAFWIILWLITPASFGYQLAAFILFRFFDALKPGPVKWADHTFKGWGYKGAFGIMFDDLIAAFLTLLVFACWRFIILWSPFFS